uniref:CortBP2 domain-containing protein n=1 Tax=Angiostrongylus cantonensis TaxID=6313 RepID=A0A0K0CWP6_ANGCA
MKGTNENERAKFLLYDAKYGKLCGNDPMCALRRDSTMTEEDLDEYEIGQLYGSQLVQLEKLIAVQRRSHLRAKSLLAAAEKRHLKALKELELEKERKSRYAAQGDDVLALLEKEREKLTQQLEIQINDIAESKAETERVERKLEMERERHKAMVLFLINERKQMLVKMHELRVKSESYIAMTSGEQALLEELKKEIAFLREERDSLKNMNKSLKAENLSLKEVVKGQEADLLMLRKNLMSSTKLGFDNQGAIPHLAEERSLVVANRMATSTVSPVSSSSGPMMSSGTLSPRTRLATSSSFPTEKSRLPRAPSSPARGLSSPRLPCSPIKKTPAMGVGTARRAPPPRYAEPELQELEAAIESMANHGRI